MDRSMLQGIKHVRGRVHAILRECPDTRNCDKLLCVTYWKLVDGVRDLDGITRATCPEAIRRARQILNERGTFLATDPLVRQKRKQSLKSISVEAAST